MMQIIQMIWTGTGGLGIGTVLLKALFILILGAIAWMLCELTKHFISAMAKLAVDALRYLAIAIRGWPKYGENSDTNKHT